MSERLSEIEAREAFHDTHQQTPDQGARDRPHAAEDDDGECDQYKGVSHLGIDVIGRDQEAGSDCKTGGTEAEGDGVDVSHFDARELGAELFSRHRADGFAGVAQSHEQPQSDCHDDHGGKRHDAWNGEKRGAELDDVERIVESDRAGIRTKCVKQGVLDHHSQSERHQQIVAILAVRGWSDHAALQTVAYNKEQRSKDQRRNIGIKPEQSVGEECREHGRGEQRTMGKVDDVQNAVDQREPERHQRVERAGEEPIEHRWNKNARREHCGADGARPEPLPAGVRSQARGIGNTGFADAKLSGRITWMSLPSTWVLTGAAPWF